MPLILPSPARLSAQFRPRAFSQLSSASAAAKVPLPKMLRRMTVLGAAAAFMAVFWYRPTVSANSGRNANGEHERRAAKEGLPSGAAQEAPVAADDDGLIDIESDSLRVVKSGPCGQLTVASIGCLNASKTRPRGVDCVDSFKAMQKCLTQVCIVGGKAFRVG
jgi:hypothetical protein